MPAKKSRFIGVQIRAGKHLLCSTIPQTYSTAIGQIVTEWAFSESLIERLIQKLLQVGDEETRIIATQMNIRPKLEIVRLLAKRRITNVTLLKQIAMVTKNAEDLSDLRNRVVHGLWGKREGSTNPRRMVIYWYRGKGDNRVTPATYPVTSAGLTMLAANIRSLNFGLVMLGANVAAALAPSPAKS